LINMVHIQLIFWQFLLHPFWLHVLPNITCAAQHYMCCPTLHVLPNITCAAQHYMCCPT
jgi:hypothetical protein